MRHPSMMNYFSVIVIEEPDEEPKIYEQQVSHENIGPERLPSYSKKRRRNKMKYQRQNTDPSPRFQKGNEFNPHEVFDLNYLTKKIISFFYRNLMVINIGHVLFVGKINKNLNEQ